MANEVAYVDSLKEKLEENINELRKRYPEHVLLRHAEPVLLLWKFEHEEYNEFVELFAPDEKTTETEARENYLLAIERALDIRD